MMRYNSSCSDFFSEQAEKPMIAANPMHQNDFLLRELTAALNGVRLQNLKPHQQYVREVLDRRLNHLL
jgi:hypothetical protein